MKYQHLLGLLLCASVFFAGFLLKGHLGLYLNLASLMIVVGGSATAALLCFRLERLGIVARVVRASYRSRLKPEAEIVDILIDLAIKSRMAGILSLQKDEHETSVLFLQKKTQEQKDIEEKSGTMADYNIFMAMVEKVGHDKRGNPTFKRDKEGNEILVPDTNSVLVLGTTGEGDRTVSHEQKRKVEDDQTPDVPAIFTEWKTKEGLAW